MGTEPCMVEQVEIRLQAQATAVDELKEDLTRERAAAEKRGHDLDVMMGQLMEEVDGLGSRAQEGEPSGQRPTPNAGGAAGRSDASPYPDDTESGKRCFFFLQKCGPAGINLAREGQQGA